jgi:hypothetical protein
MTRCLPILILLLLLPGFVRADEQTSPSLTQNLAPSLDSLLRRDFAANALWDDGQAEVATYDASRIVYGKARPHTARLITVYEDLTKEFYTKADWPYGQKPILPVLKQIYLATIPTANYDYQYMTSTFVDRGEFGRTVKLTVSSQDWCGLTTKAFELWGNKPRMVYTSYWDGEGTGVRELGSNLDDHFEEDLFLNLRALPFKDGLRAAFWLYPPQTTPRAQDPRAVPAALTVAPGNEMWIVVVEARDGRELRYEFATEYPHVLRKFDHSDGRTMTLKSPRTLRLLGGERVSSP